MMHLCIFKYCRRQSQHWKKKQAAHIASCFIWHLFHALMLLLSNPRGAPQLKCLCVNKRRRKRVRLLTLFKPGLCSVFVCSVHLQVKTQNCSLSYSNQTEAYLSDSSVVPILPITSHAWTQAEEEGGGPCKQMEEWKRRKTKTEHN